MPSVKRTKNFIRQTFINGIIFLIPVVAIAWIFSGAVSGIAPVYNGLRENEFIQKVGGPLLVLLICVLLIISIVFLTGVLIHFTFLQKVNGWLEKQVLSMVPGYEVYKTMMEERFHLKQSAGKVVLVQWPESKRLGIEVETHGDGTATVYFPHSSLTGGGTVHIVPQSQLRELDMKLNEMEEILNRLGAGLAKYLPADS